MECVPPHTWPIDLDSDPARAGQRGVRLAVKWERRLSLGASQNPEGNLAVTRRRKIGAVFSPRSQGEGSYQDPAFRAPRVLSRDRSLPREPRVCAGAEAAELWLVFLLLRGGGTLKWGEGVLQRIWSHAFTPSVCPSLQDLRPQDRLHRLPTLGSRKHQNSSMTHSGTVM